MYSTQAHYGSLAMPLERPVRSLHMVTKHAEKNPYIFHFDISKTVVTKFYFILR